MTALLLFSNFLMAAAFLLEMQWNRKLTKELATAQDIADRAITMLEQSGAWS